MGADRSRRGPRSRAAWAIVVVVAVGALGWAVVNSPFFAIEAIHVRGNVALSADRVVGLSGVHRGDNLLRLSTDRVIRQVARDPWVASIGIERTLPSTLVLRVVERTAVATIDTPDGTLAVAADGTVLGPARVTPTPLPSLGQMAPMHPGDALPAMSPILRVAAGLDPDLRASVGRIELTGDDVVLRLRSGGRVLYGTPTATARKNDALAAVLEWAGERGIEVAYVDVRAPERPALKPVGEPVSSPTVREDPAAG